ncbi:MAG TPA: hypothetical protein VNZ22_00565 [Bacillota bacterium]|nr:hypothetical protein [Bacillota bacterium]
MMKTIPLILWWLLYAVFRLHDKAYDTRTLRGWRTTPKTRFVYVTGWLFWGLIVIVFLVLRHAK